jgi:hypothetical protein
VLAPLFAALLLPPWLLVRLMLLPPPLFATLIIVFDNEFLHVITGYS